MITIILTLPILKSGLETGKCNRRLCSKISVLVLVLITGEPVLPPEGTPVVLEPAPPATVAPAGEDPESEVLDFELVAGVWLAEEGAGGSGVEVAELLGS